MFGITFLNSIKLIFLGLALATTLSAEVIAGPVIPLPADLKSQVEVLTDKMASFAEFEHGEGTDAMIRFWGDHLKKGFDLTDLRQYIFASNGGQPIEVLVHVNPKSVGTVSFGNRMLRESGIDFFSYRAVLDPSVPEIQDSLLKDKKSVALWTKVRSSTIPYIGLSAIAAEGALIMTGNATHPEYYAAMMMSATGVALMKLGLEWQFSKFSGGWSKVFRPKEDPVEYQRAVQLEANRQDLENKAAVKELSQIQRGLQVVARLITSSWVKNFSVNEAYQGAVVGGLMLAAELAKNFGFAAPEQNFQAGQFIWQITEMTLSFYAAFALTQVSYSSFAQNGQISEQARRGAESASIFVTAPLRLVQNIPRIGLAAWIDPDAIGRYAQLLFGAAITPFVLLKLNSSSAYARSLLAQAASNAGEPPVELSWREEQLAKFFESMPLNRQWTINDHLRIYFPKAYPIAARAGDAIVRAGKPVVTAVSKMGEKAKSGVKTFAQACGMSLD